MSEGGFVEVESDENEIVVVGGSAESYAVEKMTVRGYVAVIGPGEVCFAGVGAVENYSAGDMVRWVF